MRYSDRDVSLEACRGIAAIVVLLWHTMLAFFPNRSGIFPEHDPAKSIAGEFWFGVVHGTAAVTFFFVLSGFVLTRSFFANHDETSILRGAFKRWPRLAGPVTLVTVFSWLLFAMGLYRFEGAARITNSPWLAQFAYTSWPFKPDLWDAFAQGAFLTFFRGDASYNSSLWTMRYEFIGSFIAFGLALLLHPIHRDKPWLTAAFLIVIGLIGHLVSPYYVAFPLGVGLAAFLPREKRFMPAWLTVIALAASVYLLGYTGGGGDFALLAKILPLGAAPYVHMISAALIIVTALNSGAMRRVLSGRWARAIGELSFPLYLIHVPVICSLGSIAMVVANRLIPPPYPNIVATAVTIVAAFLCAVPLVLFDRWWRKQTNIWAFRTLGTSIPQRA